MDQPGKVANPARGQLNRGNNFPLSPCVPENLVSRDGFSRPVPRQPAHLHTQAESGAYLRDSSRVPRRRPFMKPPYAIGSVPSLSGHAIAYRWRSLPRVRRHRASKPQGSSERVLPWQITMDQLIFASLSHTHYWYEVGMLKVPAGTLEEKEETTKIFYREAVGALMWTSTMTRPDISSAVRTAAKFCENSDMAHWNAVVKILQYVRRTPEKGIAYGGDGNGRRAFVDSDHFTCLDTRRLTSGGAVRLGKGAIILFLMVQATTAEKFWRQST